MRFAHLPLYLVRSPRPQAQIPPIRMLLTGPNGASSAASSRGSAGPVLRHDFRRSCLAVVPLRLAVRNNTAMEARLQMEVRAGAEERL